MAKKLIEIKEVEVSPRPPRMAPSERLELRDLVGSGGMCQILETFDTNLLRTTAMKTLKPELAENLEYVRYLVEEAQITAQLDHPNIVPVHELGVTEDGAVYFTMKLIKGQTLKEILYEQDFRRRDEAGMCQQLLLFCKICDAISFAHDHGVIHRDIKPDNIMVGEYGEVYVMDWGLCRLKQTPRPSGPDEELPEQEEGFYPPHCEQGKVFGSPWYMAPEQARGEVDEVDERSDVFSLGAILYQILTQFPPYLADSMDDLLVKAVECRPVPPHELVDFHVPAQLGRIAMKALSKKKSRRFASVSELKQEVENFLHSGWRFPEKVFEAGDLIIRQGESGDAAYIISRGRCRVFKTVEGEKIVLRELPAGKVFGEIAVFADRPRTASMEAVERTILRVVSRKYIEEELGMGFWLSVFVKALAELFRERDARAVELEHKQELDRIAFFAAAHFNFSGTDAGAGQRRAAWSGLCGRLKKKTGRPEPEIIAALQRTGLFEIDKPRDLVLLKKP